MALDGIYEITTKTPMGDQKGTLTVKVSGDGFTGSMNSQTGDNVEIADGRVEGNTIRWQSKITTPIPMTLDNEATVDGDALTGSVTAGAFGKFAMSGKRTG